MAWRHLAAGAAGVVAAVGFTGHAAAAEGENGSAETPNPTNDLISPDDQAKLEQANALSEIANAMPPPTGPRSKKADPETTPITVPSFSASIVDATAPGQVPPIVTKRLAAVQAGADKAAAARGAAPRAFSSAPVAPTTSPTPTTPNPTPADDESPNRNSSPGPVGSATTTASTTNTTNTANPALPPSLNPGSTPDVWWPASIEQTVDQRIAEKWRGTPVRGPPPGTASALGNDGRTTISQVSVVSGRDGFEVSITSAQDVAVRNEGVALAEAHDSGSASSTGDYARTSVTQVSVVVQRGTGTANVAQDATVDNFGVGVAASAGPASASAVGNASNTTVKQTAVVLLLGSGDATLHQSTGVTNAGGATAVAIDRQATASGNSSRTDVDQIAVLVVHNDDVTVNQSSSTLNVGAAYATGGTATGNNSTNVVNQITVHP